MEYIPGPVHESFQKIHALEVLNDFIVPILVKRWNESNLIDDKSTETLNLVKGDIILVRFFKPGDTSSTCYSYIESLITKGDEHKIFRECCLSREFVVQNTINEALFNVVTKQYERENKLNQILN